jgi:hypothetical protein
VYPVRANHTGVPPNENTEIRLRLKSDGLAASEAGSAHGPGNTWSMNPATFGPCTATADSRSEAFVICTSSRRGNSSNRAVSQATSTSARDALMMSRKSTAPMR